MDLVTQQDIDDPLQGPYFLTGGQRMGLASDICKKETGDFVSLRSLIAHTDHNTWLNDSRNGMFVRFLLEFQLFGIVVGNFANSEWEDGITWSSKISKK